MPQMHDGVSFSHAKPQSGWKFFIMKHGSHALAVTIYGTLLLEVLRIPKKKRGGLA